jgi:sulfate transport system ATP-binding protein
MGIAATLQRAIVVGPLARLELVPEEAADERVIEAQMPAERFRQLALREGQRVVVAPRKARVFLSEDAARGA